MQKMMVSNGSLLLQHERDTAGGVCGYNDVASAAPWSCGKETPLRLLSRTSVGLWNVIAHTLDADCISRIPVMPDP